MPLIPFPDVPNLPGVPQVLRRAPAAPPAILGSVAGIAQLIRSFTAKPVWGVFKTSDDPNTTVIHGKPAVVPDSIIDFGYQKEWTIATAPTQQGAFTDYNRVSNPYEAHLRMSKGGSEKDRIAFLKQIDDLNSIQLYDIFTPEKVYLKCNFTRIEISRRQEKGAYFLSEVDLYFREVRIVTSQYSNTQIIQPAQASAANTQNNGTQQGIQSTATVPQSVTR